MSAERDESIGETLTRLQKEMEQRATGQYPVHVRPNPPGKAAQRDPRAARAAGSVRWDLAAERWDDGLHSVAEAATWFHRRVEIPLRSAGLLVLVFWAVAIATSEPSDQAVDLVELAVVGLAVLTIATWTVAFLFLRRFRQIAVGYDQGDVRALAIRVRRATIQLWLLAVVIGVQTCALAMAVYLEFAPS